MTDYSSPIRERGKSPFAVSPGESLVTAEETALMRIPFQYLKLESDETAVLALLNDLVISTNHLLLCQLPTSLGISPNRLRTVLSRLRLLGLISAFQFVNPDGSRAHYLIYSVSDSGRSYLKKHGVTRGTWRIASRLTAAGDGADAKRYLAAQQYAERSFSLASCSYSDIVCARDYNGNSGKVFRVGVRIDDTKSGEQLLVDGVRRNDGWSEDLTHKLARMDCTLRGPLNQAVINPVVVLVAEDSEHAEEIRMLLDHENPRFVFSLRIVNDVDVFAQKNNVIPWERRSFLSRLRDAFAS